MAQRRIPEATFPLDALPVALLEHLSLSPHRMVSLVKKFDGNVIKPRKTRILSPSLTGRDKEEYQ
ncbi:hypothetical protein CVT26_004394, partial [Gymnopilus dilepis]